jgi:hypothetical protein
VIAKSDDGSERFCGQGVSGIPDVSRSPKTYFFRFAKKGKKWGEVVIYKKKNIYRRGLKNRNVS